MPGYVYNLATGESKPTKSLSWLLRNAHKCTFVALHELQENKGKIIATISERGVPIKEFHATFASFGVMQKWVLRPCLSGAIKYTYFRHLKD